MGAAWLCLCILCRDETTVLALNGLGKVLRANMSTILALPGFNDKWDAICKIASQALMSGRKAVGIAAAQLLTGFLQVRPLLSAELAAAVSRRCVYAWLGQGVASATVVDCCCRC